ncbi:MAG: 2-oxo acid dehydrogenase subunit E2 [Dehalococcoidia bacterium]|nr:2-oxo acid dehydrogenase subunit E2 [Dehalococcoidia bacterium]
MRIDLPQVGETVTEGVVVKWLKQPGDAVKAFEPLVEIETDKVTMELPSPAGGVLKAHLAKEGDTVAVGGALCELDVVAGASVAGPALASPAQERAINTTGVFTESNLPEGPTGAQPIEAGVRPATPPAPVAAAAKVPPAPAPAAPAPAGTPRLSPLVKRLAAEHHLSDDELSGITGTGIGGRVSKEDVQRYVEQRRGKGAPAPAPTAIGSADERQPLTPVRRRIAAHVTRVAHIPTAWTMVEADVTGLVALREASKQAFRQRHNADLTYLPFAVQAVATSLREHPKLNASWDGDAIILKKRINIGIAVATPEGLIVPVVHDADTLGIVALARAIGDLGERARQRTLALPDVQGGTFTVDNTGALGSVVSQPLLNGNEAAIITTEAMVKRPVVVGDGIAIRAMMNLCLTFDHRVMDGHEAAAFLQSVKRRLEAITPGAIIQ